LSHLLLRELAFVIRIKSTVVLDKTIHVRALGLLLRLDVLESIATEIAPVVGRDEVL